MNIHFINIMFTAYMSISSNCPSANEAILKNMGKQIT